ncbi:MAG TPA: hypothetical protein VFO85_19510, partial [Vicinamibacteria bacterium]|nr:hypothetical protein [Vicinamibacteria bacterium]
MQRHSTLALWAILAAAPAAPAAESPAADPLIVVNREGVTLLDPGTYLVKAAVALGPDVDDAFLSADERFVYVDHAASTEKGGDSRRRVLSVLDTATGRVRATVDLGPGRVAAAQAPDGSRLYLLTAGPQGPRITVVEPQGGAAGHIELPGPAMALLAAPDGRRLYALHPAAADERDQGRLSVIDVERAQVVRSIPLPDAPRSAIATPDGGRVLVVSAASAVLIDAQAGTEVHRFVMRKGGDMRLHQAVVSADGRRAYVNDDVGFFVYALDLVAGGAPRDVSILGSAFDFSGKRGVEMRSREPLMALA